MQPYFSARKSERVRPLSVISLMSGFDKFCLPQIDQSVGYLIQKRWSLSSSTQSFPLETRSFQGNRLSISFKSSNARDVTGKDHLRLKAGDDLSL